MRGGGLAMINGDADKTGYKILDPQTRRNVWSNTHGVLIDPAQR